MEENKLRYSFIRFDPIFSDIAYRTVELLQEMDDLDDGIFKPKQKSTASRDKMSATLPASKPDPPPPKTKHATAKPQGEIN